MQQGATLYTIQLGLNLIWMPLFFGLKRPIEATVDIVALTGVTGYLTYIWSQVDPVAAWGIVPYVGWLSFATYLSVSALTSPHWYWKDTDAITRLAPDISTIGTWLTRRSRRLPRSRIARSMSTRRIKPSEFLCQGNRNCGKMPEV